MSFQDDRHRRDAAEAAGADGSDADSGSDSCSDGAAEDAQPVRHRPLVFWNRSVYVCPWPDCKPAFQPTKDPTAALAHLQAVHGVHVEQVAHVMPFLDEYLKHWADQVELRGWAALEPCRVGSRFLLGRPGLLPEDDAVRADFRRRTLEAVLRIQERERSDEALAPRQCLFCRIVAPDRAALFAHMFQEHGFSIGLADNLVHVNEFLDTLQRHLTNLVCIYCERIFKSNVVLRKHMRKKKHFKIHPRNQFYDRYYVINYAEPDATAHRDEEDSLEQNDWEDWNEEDAEEPTMCLFDETVLPSVEAAYEHMKAEHGFDLRVIARDHRLSFHDVIRLMNYVRSQTFRCACFSCEAAFEDLHALETHYAQVCKFALPPRDARFWTDPKFLAPFYDNDPLLTLDVLDDDEDGGEDGGDGGMARRGGGVDGSGQRTLGDDAGTACKGPTSVPRAEPVVVPESQEHLLELMQDSVIKMLDLDDE
ncbi:hypothetical protein HK105_207813 [Polyrhizophydium stewartii]|uniref:C2H2-type domain-containing protein n=1 Tax=Polyrhizophydium stewartii TaxID=2732419 RepID=A0ABR4MZJ5_9FUNG|nr:hypothetical protein HK105_007257 [Polyrhizophydium stewartii]